MRIENEIQLAREARIAVICKMVQAHMQCYEYRCYLKPAKINGFPLGYGGAMTFKVVKCKMKEKRE